MKKNIEIFFLRGVFQGIPKSGVSASLSGIDPLGGQIRTKSGHCWTTRKSQVLFAYELLIRAMYLRSPSLITHYRIFHLASSLTVCTTQIFLHLSRFRTIFACFFFFACLHHTLRTPGGSSRGLFNHRFAQSFSRSLFRFLPTKKHCGLPTSRERRIRRELFRRFPHKTKYHSLSALPRRRITFRVPERRPDLPQICHNREIHQ